MLRYLSSLSRISLVASILIFTTCKKADDNSEQVKKESVINLLNINLNSDSLKSYAAFLEKMGTRFALANNHRVVADKIKDKFISFGIADCKLDSFQIKKTYKNLEYNQWQYNVIATIKGLVNPDSVSIICAHYDNILKKADPFLISYGANDNACGVASVIEMARVMMKNNYHPSNTIEFIAFAAEEIGMLGSYDYSNKSKKAGKNIKMVINNDMIAYQQGSEPSAWVVNIMDYDNSHDLRTKAEKICSKYTLMTFYNDNVFNKFGDCYPFFKNDYKAVFFTSTILDPYHHTIDDVSAKCNFEYCREITKLCCALLVDNN